MNMYLGFSSEDLIRFSSYLYSWGYGPDKIMEFCRDLDQIAAGQLRVKNRIARLKEELAELEATIQP